MNCSTYNFFVQLIWHFQECFYTTSFSRDEMTVVPLVEGNIEQQLTIWFTVSTSFPQRRHRVSPSSYLYVLSVFKSSVPHRMENMSLASAGRRYVKYSWSFNTSYSGWWQVWDFLEFSSFNCWSTCSVILVRTNCFHFSFDMFIIISSVTYQAWIIINVLLKHHL